MNRSHGWGKKEGLDLYWTQAEFGGGKWSGHGMVWTNAPKNGRLLATIYVRDGTYAISTFGLGGLEPNEQQSLEKHLERTLNLTKRETNWQASE